MIFLRSILIIYIFLFSLNSNNILFATKSGADNIRSDLNYLNKAKLLRMFEDIDLIEEISTLNTMIFRSTSSKNNIYKNHSKSIVYVGTDTGYTGSGVVINDEGEILTNAHVIEGAKKIYTIFKPKKGNNVIQTVIHEAEILKLDPRRDLALIKPLYPPNEILPILIVKSNDIENDFVGTDAHCIGHPDGLTWTYTKGVISAYRPNHQWSYDKILMLSANVLQVDCSINPGNSGGALISDQGNLLGINSFIDLDNTLINFAVAADELIDFINSNNFKKPTPIDALIEIAQGDPIFVKGEKFNESTGYYDIEYWDTDRNGTIDTIRHFLDDDNLPDLIEYDDNENGLTDSTIEFLTDGTKYHYFDNDEDGINNYLFIDYGNNGSYEVKKKIS